MGAERVEMVQRLWHDQLHSMINDGLNATNPAGCTNNKQTTWTYNQGVILVD
jgi:hypothetical protein